MSINEEIPAEDAAKVEDDEVSDYIQDTDIDEVLKNQVEI